MIKSKDVDLTMIYNFVVDNIFTRNYLGFQIDI
jgi:hypothetical protein